MMDPMMMQMFMQQMQQQQNMNAPNGWQPSQMPPMPQMPPQMPPQGMPPQMPPQMPQEQGFDPMSALLPLLLLGGAGVGAARTPWGKRQMGRGMDAFSQMRGSMPRRPQPGQMADDVMPPTAPPAPGPGGPMPQGPGGPDPAINQMMMAGLDDMVAAGPRDPMNDLMYAVTAGGAARPSFTQWQKARGGKGSRSTFQEFLHGESLPQGQMNARVPGGPTDMLEAGQAGRAKFGEALHGSTPEKPILANPKRSPSSDPEAAKALQLESNRVRDVAKDLKLPPTSDPSQADELYASPNAIANVIHRYGLGPDAMFRMLESRGPGESQVFVRGADAGQGMVPIIPIIRAMRQKAGMTLDKDVVDHEAGLIAQALKKGRSNPKGQGANAAPKAEPAATSAPATALEPDGPAFEPLRATIDKGRLSALNDKRAEILGVAPQRKDFASDAKHKAALKKWQKQADDLDADIHETIFGVRETPESKAALNASIEAKFKDLPELDDLMPTTPTAPQAAKPEAVAGKESVKISVAKTRSSTIKDNLESLSLEDVEKARSRLLETPPDPKNYAPDEYAEKHEKFLAKLDKLNEAAKLKGGKAVSESGAVRGGRKGGKVSEDLSADSEEIALPLFQALTMKLPFLRRHSSDVLDRNVSVQDVVETIQATHQRRTQVTPLDFDRAIKSLGPDDVARLKAEGQQVAPLGQILKHLYKIQGSANA